VRALGQIVSSLLAFFLSSLRFVIAPRNFPPQLCGWESRRECVRRENVLGDGLFGFEKDSFIFLASFGFAASALSDTNKQMNSTTTHSLSMHASSAASRHCLPRNKSYADLVNEALLCSPKRSGSASLQAIKRHICSQYPDFDLKGTYLRAALKKAISDERIVKVKGCFKISSAEKRVLMRRRSIVSSVSHARTKQQSKQLAPSTASPSSSPIAPLRLPFSSPSKKTTPLSRPVLRSSNIKRRLRSSSTGSGSARRAFLLMR
jgi:hypothetical protein